MYSGMPCSNTLSILCNNTLSIHCNNTLSIPLTFPSDYTASRAFPNTFLHPLKTCEIHNLGLKLWINRRHNNWSESFFYVTVDVSSCRVVVSFPWLVSNLQEKVGVVLMSSCDPYSEIWGWSTMPVGSFLV
jgi:hypothetical protein